MRRAAEGEDVEVRVRSGGIGWGEAFAGPVWDWNYNEYRIKEKPREPRELMADIDGAGCVIGAGMVGVEDEWIAGQGKMVRFREVIE